MVGVSEQIVLPKTVDHRVGSKVISLAASLKLRNCPNENYSKEGGYPGGVHTDEVLIGYIQMDPGEVHAGGALMVYIQMGLNGCIYRTQMGYIQVDTDSGIYSWGPDGDIQIYLDSDIYTSGSTCIYPIWPQTGIYRWGPDGVHADGTRRGTYK